MKVIMVCVLLAGLTSCSEPAVPEAVSYQTRLINEEGATIQRRFNPPAGFERKSTDGFGIYLRSLKLKKHGSTVNYYNGEEKEPGAVYCAVVDMEIGDKNLQQCADAVMRLRGEYLFSAKQYDQIHFNFTNGFRADYAKWRAGNRIAVKGNNVSWVRSGSADDSYSGFRNYMDIVFTYAGTLSLARELKIISYKDMQVGDVLIKGGSPGHAVVVVDMAENRLGRKVYMLAQSYMPAQETQVLLNPSQSEFSPWYELEENDQIIETPEWTFSSGDLKRF
ncbi:MAG: hypothetical protein K0R82_475 [Flavipsychrobacter sp.]|nr:hypothetical protein [Flavipsychrobacter sp.]